MRLRQFVLATLFTTLPIASFAQAANPLTANVKIQLGALTGFVIRSAEKVSAILDLFRGLRPMCVRWGQLYGHIADALFSMCSVTGRTKTAPIRDPGTPAIRGDLMRELPGGLFQRLCQYRPAPGPGRGHQPGRLSTNTKRAAMGTARNWDAVMSPRRNPLPGGLPHAAFLLQAGSRSVGRAPAASVDRGLGRYQRYPPIDAYKDGAKNHSPDEGPWGKRKRKSMRAYFEWCNP